MTRPEIRNQGRALVQESKTVPGLWIVVTPDNDVHVVDSREAAESLATRWFRRHSARKGNVISVGTIETTE